MNIYESIQSNLNEIDENQWNEIKKKVKEHFEYEYSDEGKHYGFGMRSGYLTDNWINALLSDLRIIPNQELKNRINDYYKSLLDGKEE